MLPRPFAVLGVSFSDPVTLHKMGYDFLDKMTLRLILA